MSKIKSILFFLLISFIVLAALVLLKIKNNEQIRQKINLAHSMRDGLDRMMFDLREATENTIQDVPADGQWHDRIAFIRPRQGILEYLTKEGRLLRVDNGKSLLMAANIKGLRIRRQMETPDMLEVQVEAQKDVSLIINLRIKLRG